MKIYKIITSILLCTMPHIGYGQQQRYSTIVTAPDTSGYFRIKLMPNVVGLSQNSLADIRIYDNTNIETPYIVLRSNVSHGSLFKDYAIVDKQVTDSSTILVLHNAKKQRIDNINLVVANAEVNKTMKLTGSYDKSTWYSVKEIETVQSVVNPNDVSAMKALNFPLTDYEYLKIEINDKTSSPINILKAGYFESFTTNGEKTPVPLTFIQSDSISHKKSYITINFDSVVVVNKLMMQVTSPPLFMRNATVYSIFDNNKGQRHYETSVVLKSDEPINIHLSSTKCRKLLIEIDNRDNAPLEIKQVEALMTSRFLLAQLKKNVTYTITFGDQQKTAPQYDLAHFKDKINNPLGDLMHDRIELLGIATEVKKAQPWYADKRVMWAAIILASALLAYFTWSMMKEQKK